MAGAFPARFPGRCPVCSECIHEGDPIRRLTDDGSAYVHDDCDAAAPPEPKDHPVCQTCWLTHPEGACDR